MKDFLRFLFNGGLDPQLADEKQLRQRRTVSSMYFLILPLLIVLLVINLIWFNAPVENSRLIAMLIVGVPALFLQAYKGWENLAAVLLVASFVAVPASVIFQLGLSSVNWVWMFPSVVIGNLVLDRKTAVVAAVIGMLCMVVFGTLTHLGRIAPDVTVATHENAVAVTGSLLLIIICAAGFTFRTIQIKDEAKLTAQVSRVDEEVKIRARAEALALDGKRLKAIFLETINHELRTPLNGVIGAGQLLADKAGSPQEQELVDVITHSGELLLDLVNNVVDLTEMEAGQLTLATQPTHLESTIKSVLAPLLLSGREKGVEVEYKILPTVPEYVKADSTRLRQILLNLCGNALKFTDAGKVTVLVSRQHEQIRFDIKDTGIGISESEQDKLFQPFVQADSSTARRYGGSGLGLTIVSQLVDLFDGQISLDSSLGVGSTVTVLLPLQECSPPSLDANLDDQNAATSHTVILTALIVDDNAVNRLVASRMLKSLGCATLEVSNGYEALRMLKQHPVDVVFMDVQMPIMDGITTTSRIRALNSALAMTPVVGVSANVIDYDASKRLPAGMDYYLPKPLRLEQLQSVMMKLQRQPRRELAPSSNRVELEQA